MSTLAGRVAYLEGKAEEHSHGFGETRDLIMHLNSRGGVLVQAKPPFIYFLVF